MSTRLTKNNIPMVDSSTLKLVQASAQVQELINEYLCQALVLKGFYSVTPSVLGFLSTLECGVNYASEIARNLGVTRQMVAKTVKEQCRLGYLTQVDAKGKQKEIVFTEQGELLIASARQLLVDVDDKLNQQFGEQAITATLQGLANIQQVVAELKS